jgi:hypothetical protein
MLNTPSREMPGSVTLKTSIPMEYSRATLTNIWSVEIIIVVIKTCVLFFRHQKREAEPKDNDLNKLPVRNMHISTYKHISTDGEVQ